MAGPLESDTEMGERQSPALSKDGSDNVRQSPALSKDGSDNVRQSPALSKDGSDNVSFNEAYPPGNYRIGHLLKENEVEKPELSDTESLNSILTLTGAASSKLCPSEISALDEMEMNDDGNGDDSGYGISDSSDTVYAGEVMIGLQYDHELGVLHVRVLKAKDLHPFGSKRHVDPYVKIYLTSTAFKRKKQRTRAVKHTLAPGFNEKLTFPIEHQELFTSTCCISVWHYDFFGENVPLGDAYISMEKYIEAGFSLDVESTQWYSLHSPRAVEYTQLEFNGYLRVGLQYNPPGSVETESRAKKTHNPTKGLFCIRILEAKDFETSFNLIYFKFALAIAGGRTLKEKSDMVATSSPSWNEYFNIEPVSWGELEHSYLQISLKGKKATSQFISGARLGLGKLPHPSHDSFGTEVKAWQTMLDNPNEPCEFWIPLRNNLGSVKQLTIVPPQEVITISEEEYIARTRRRESVDTLSLDSLPSRLSWYSADGETDGKLVPTGAVFFSIRHSLHSNTLHVNVLKAQGIACIDCRRNTSNPYIKTHLLPDATLTSKRRTAHVMGTTSPVWNESIKYDISREELQKKILKVSIWNYDKFERNAFMGDVLVNMKQYAACNDLSIATPAWYALQDTPPYCVGGGVNGMLLGTAPQNPAEHNVGDIQVGVEFQNNTLSVFVRRASGLQPVIQGALPDPFVRCYLLPVMTTTNKRKTTIKNATLQPVWNELFEYSGLSVDDLYTSVLEVTVWHAEPSGHHFMGGVRLGLSGGSKENIEEWQDSFGKEVVVWETMLKNLGMVAELSIPLRSTMQSRKGLITEDIITNALDKTTYFQTTATESRFLPTLRLSMKFEENSLGATPKKNKRVKGTLTVLQISASNLPSDYSEDAPSTFCEGQLRVKGKRIPKYRTEVYLKSPNPKWDEVMSFTGITLDDLRASALELVVYDQLIEKREEIIMIGFIRLAESNVRRWEDSSGKEVGMWRSLLNNPSRVIMEEIPLRIKLDDEQNNQGEVGEEERGSRRGSAAQTEYVEEATELEQAIANAGRASPKTAALRAMGAKGGGGASDQAVSQCILYASDIDIDTESMKAGELLLQLEGATKSRRMLDLEKKAQELLLPPTVKEGAVTFDEDKLRQIAKAKSNTTLPSLTNLKTMAYENSGGDEVAEKEAKEWNVKKLTYIRGDLQLSVRYNHADNAFELHLHQARMINAVNKVNETSNTFCKAYLLPDVSKAGKRKTMIRMDSINPEWDQLLEYSVAMRDLRSRTLWVSVWHVERFRPNLFLGEVMLEMVTVIDDKDTIKPEHTKPRWYPLCQKTPTAERMVSKGEITFSILFEDKRLAKDQTMKEREKVVQKKSGEIGKIYIHLKGCKNLPAGDSTGLSDPYCECNLLPSKPAKHKKVSPVIRYTLNPEWDYQFDFDCDYDYLSEHGVEFLVKDWDRVTRDDFLGYARINLGNYTHKLLDAEGVEIDAWQHLIDNPNLMKEFTIPLQVKPMPNGRAPKISVSGNAASKEFRLPSQVRVMPKGSAPKIGVSGNVASPKDEDE